jgi:hypothetical protein
VFRKHPKTYRWIVAHSSALAACIHVIETSIICANLIRCSTKLKYDLRLDNCQTVLQHYSSPVSFLMTASRFALYRVDDPRCNTSMKNSFGQRSLCGDENISQSKRYTLSGTCYQSYRALIRSRGVECNFKLEFPTPQNRVGKTISGRILFYS